MVDFYSAVMYAYTQSQLKHKEPNAVHLFEQFAAADGTGKEFHLEKSTPNSGENCFLSTKRKLNFLG